MKKRKDEHGRVLRTGESQKKSGGYVFRSMQNGHRVTISAPTLEALRKKEQDFQNQISRGIDVAAAQRFTINDGYYRYCAGRTDLKPTTREHYEQMFRCHIKNSIGKRKMKDVLYSDLVGYYANLMNNGAGAGLATGVNGVISWIYKKALRDRLITYNPVTGAISEAKKITGKTIGRGRALTEKEQAAFTRYIIGHDDYIFWVPFITFLLGTGVRIGEACALTWADVDFKQNEIHISKAIERVKRGLYITTPKTKTSSRIIPMFSVVHKALIDVRKYQLKHGGCIDTVDDYDNFVFMTPARRVLYSSVVDSRLKRMVKRYNKAETARAEREDREPVILPNITAHMFRHTFATRAIESGMDWKAVQEIMGHADISLTLNTYADVSNERKHKVIESLEGKMQIV